MSVMREKLELCGNRRYYPFYIYKIFDEILDGEQRWVLSHIHLQSEKTRKKYEIEWREIRLRLHCQMNEQIPQKSEAWYKQRVRYVGTSEITHLPELTYFTRYADLLARMVGSNRLLVGAFPPVVYGVRPSKLWLKLFCRKMWK